MAKFTFQKATKQKAKLRLALVGPSGSGKTYSALAIATELVGPSGRVAVIDTEHGAASKYAGRFSFDVLELESFSPSTYVDALKAAADAGYDAVVIDSLSHAWMGKDGALEQVDKAAKRANGNGFAAWRDVTPQHNALVEGMISTPMHVIATMRAKTEYVMEKDSRGKSVPRKIGLAPVQRDGLEYEFDLYADITLDHEMIVGKTRCEALDRAVVANPGANVAKVLLAWLSDGVDAPKAAPRFSAPTSPAANQQQGSDELDEALIESYVEKIALAVECDTAQKMIALGNELGEARASGALRGATLRAVADAFAKGRNEHKARLQGRRNGSEAQS